jgi:DNA repair exonuclease SbcCD nuclease subunit
MDLLSMSFGQIFQCPLVNTTVNPVAIQIDQKKPMRLLLLSDTHLGATDASNVNKSIDLFLTEVGSLIEREHITHICHLGDLLDGTIVDPEPLKRALLGLGTLGLPVYAMGGNHDREVFTKLPKDLNKKNIFITNEMAMVLDIPARPGRKAQKIFLAHDLGNNYRVRDQFAFLFLMWIKNACHPTIKPSDWLLTGHCHGALLSHENRVGCVGQFSPEISAYGYGIVEIGASVNICTKYNISKMP